MRQIVSIAAALLASVTVAQAAPVALEKPVGPEAAPLAQQVASWRYHEKCGWRGGRWVVDLGAGRIIACRPNRPGRDYVWRDEGPRHGWYHRRERRWFHNQW